MMGLQLNRQPPARTEPLAAGQPFPVGRALVCLLLLAATAGAAGIVALAPI